jgi:hypothetical protein
VTTLQLPLKQITHKLCLGDTKGFHSKKHTASEASKENPALKNELDSTVYRTKILKSVQAGQTPIYQGKLTASRSKKNEVLYDTNWGNGILNIGNGTLWNMVMSSTQESVSSSTRHMPRPSHSSRFYHPHNIG